MDFAESAKRGTWPVAGGRLDQSASFEAAARMIWAEQSATRREMKIDERED